MLNWSRNICTTDLILSAGRFLYQFFVLPQIHGEQFGNLSDAYFRPGNVSESVFSEDERNAGFAAGVIEGYRAEHVAMVRDSQRRHPAFLRFLYVLRDRCRPVKEREIRMVVKMYETQGYSP